MIAYAQRLSDRVGKKSTNIGSLIKPVNLDIFRVYRSGWLEIRESCFPTSRKASQGSGKIGQNQLQRLTEVDTTVVVVIAFQISKIWVREPEGNEDRKNITRTRKSV